MLSYLVAGTAIATAFEAIHGMPSPLSVVQERILPTVGPESGIGPRLASQFGGGLLSQILLCALLYFLLSLYRTVLRVDPGQLVLLPDYVFYISVQFFLCSSIIGLLLPAVPGGLMLPYIGIATFGALSFYYFIYVPSRVFTQRGARPWLRVAAGSAMLLVVWAVLLALGFVWLDFVLAPLADLPFPNRLPGQ